MAAPPKEAARATAAASVATSRPRRTAVGRRPGRARAPAAGGGPRCASRSTVRCAFRAGTPSTAETGALNHEPERRSTAQGGQLEGLEVVGVIAAVLVLEQDREVLRLGEGVGGPGDRFGVEEGGDAGLAVAEAFPLRLARMCTMASAASPGGRGHGRRRCESSSWPGSAVARSATAAARTAGSPVMASALTTTLRPGRWRAAG